MKIALLNLPVDNNYGGNLQRYALMKVLQDMGHDVTHICLLYKARLKWYKYPFSYTYRIIMKYVLRQDLHVRQEFYDNRKYQRNLIRIKPFYDKYIKHTEACYTESDILRAVKEKYIAYVVGSDQCWRKDMTGSIGWQNFLFDFIKDSGVKRIAYGISFGKDSNMYSDSDFSKFRRLYRKFVAVSVRENSAINILGEMQCTSPTPIQVLDPTLLLNKSDYTKLFCDIKEDAPSKGMVFCYVLDKTEEIIAFAQKKATELSTCAVFYGISESNGLSVEMWLKCIFEAAFVVTDSYHGSIFSIIFGKPFLFYGNERRGNDRISSLLKVLEITDTTNCLKSNDNLDKWKTTSIAFLRKALSES